MGLALAIPDAEAARRLGGGKSVGTQRQSTQQQAEPRQAQPQQQAAPQQGPAAAPAAGNRWLGPVAGLLAGGVLGALFFGGAFDGIKFMDVALILLLAGGLFFLFRMLRKPRVEPARRQPLQYAGVGAEPRVEPELRQPAAVPSSATPLQPAGNYFPVGFDAEGFARQAKNNFLRLQEANDRADIGALREMMIPSLFHEIEAQIRERGNAPQKTEVVTLDAKVMEVVTEGDQYVASVRFRGLIREEPSAQPESFDEIWHLQKPLNGSTGWLMAGIQQA
jgi:predicted lipid-binding transport protein (Tim44 family)